MLGYEHRLLPRFERERNSILRVVLDIADLNFPMNSNISAKIQECLCASYQLFPHSIRVPGWKLQKNKWLAVYEGLEIQNILHKQQFCLLTQIHEWKKYIHIYRSLLIKCLLQWSMKIIFFFHIVYFKKQTAFH